MKKPYYSWFASDFLGSPFVQSLEPLEEFCYRRLLDMQATSEDGRISGDVKKMKAQCKHLASFQRIWEVIKVKFEPHPDGNGGFANSRLMEILANRDEYLDGRSRAGKLGAEARWKDKQTDGKANGSAIGIPNGKVHGETMASTSTSNPISKKKKTGKEQGDSPPAEKRGGRIDPAADLFKDSYLLHKSNPYAWQDGDFEQLAGLRKRLGLIHPQIPPGWSDALINYYATPQKKYSLRDLCVNFDAFKDSPIDRYGKPLNHVNTGGSNGTARETENDKNNRAVKDFITRSLAPEVRSDIPDVREESDGLPRPIRLLS